MTQEKHPTEEFVPVNQVLNIKPRLGPIPGEQVVPWLCIFFLAYLLCQGIMGLSWTATGLVTAWGLGTWWCMTGDESWRFLTKFTGVPRWTRGYAPYGGLLEPALRNRRIRRSRRRTVRRTGARR